MCGSSLFLFVGVRTVSLHLLLVEHRSLRVRVLRIPTRLVTEFDSFHRQRILIIHLHTASLGKAVEVLYMLALQVLHGVQGALVNFRYCWALLDLVDARLLHCQRFFDPIVDLGCLDWLVRDHSRAFVHVVVFRGQSMTLIVIVWSFAWRSW